MVYWSNVMLALIIGVNAFYIGGFVNNYMRTEGFVWSYWDLVWIGIYGLVVGKTYSMICSSLESGLSPEYALDVFVIFITSQIISLFSPYWGGKLLLSIPAYIVYKLGGYAMDYCCKKASETVPDQTDEQKKKAEKKARKDALAEKRGNVKYVKH